MAPTNNVKGWTGVLMTEDSSSHWPIKRRHVYSETSPRASLGFVCVFGHDAVNKNDRALRLCRRRDGWGRNGCAPQKVDPAVRDLLFCGSQLRC